MANTKKWTREDLLEEIIDLAKRNNGIATSTVVSSSFRRKVTRQFGSWRNACMLANVDCPSLNKKYNKKRYERGANASFCGKDFDVSEGIQIHNYATSICFECARSGAPKALRCTWDAELQLPKGAVYHVKECGTDNGEVSKLPLVLYCPYFVANEDENFNQLIRKERKRVLADAIENGFGGMDGKVIM